MEYNLESPNMNIYQFIMILLSFLFVTKQIQIMQMNTNNAKATAISNPIAMSQDGIKYFTRY
jgi:hypothetical protein